MTNKNHLDYHLSPTPLIYYNTLAEGLDYYNSQAQQRLQVNLANTVLSAASFVPGPIGISANIVSVYNSLQGARPIGYSSASAGLLAELKWIPRIIRKGLLERYSRAGTAYEYANSLDRK